MELPPVEPPSTPPPLPGPRQLISVGLDLAMRTRADLRTGSLAIGVQLMAAAGPFVLLMIVLAGRAPDLFVAFDQTAPSSIGPQEEALAGPLAMTTLVAGFALIALVIEGRIIAAALLGGAAGGRPVTVREALRRSRQVFWAVVGATIVIQLPIALVSNVVTDAAFGALAGSVEALTVLGLVVTTTLSVPFAYVMTGIVLGGVSAIEAIRRSVGLAGVRWRLAIVVAVADSLAQTLLALGLLAGLDILGGISDALGLGIDRDPVTTFVTLGVALAATAAVGSLLFTVGAIAAAPQVVAFVGLTHFTGGLDGARDGAPTAQAARWVSVPMAIGIALALLASLAGAAALPRPA